MFTIVGLGNPGEKYQSTRHNAGWLVLAYVMKKNGLPSMVDSAKCSGKISQGTLGGYEVTVLFPTTFMNRSGSAVKKLVATKDAAQTLIVVYDDVDLPLGSMRISMGRGSGGHNGVQSIIDTLGTKDFIRIRIGVASRTFFGGIARPKGERLTAHILKDFKKKELRALEEVSEKVDGALSSILKDGVERAMSAYN